MLSSGCVSDQLLQGGGGGGSAGCQALQLQGRTPGLQDTCPLRAAPVQAEMPRISQGGSDPHRAWSTRGTWSSNTALQWHWAPHKGHGWHRAPTARNRGTCSDSSAWRMLELQVWLPHLLLFRRGPSPQGGFARVWEENLSLLSCSLAHSPLLKPGQHLCPPG